MQEESALTKSYDVIVIGAGAAGMMAAGTAARNGKSVLLLEKMEKSGRKVRISGKGRCNVTNARPPEEISKLEPNKRMPTIKKYIQSCIIGPLKARILSALVKSARTSSEASLNFLFS